MAILCCLKLEMRLLRSNFAALSILQTLLLLVGLSSLQAQPDDTEQLAIIRKWLPYYQTELQLIFEYNANESNEEAGDSKKMHKAIDRAGATITIISARAPYDKSPRIIGGYNPRSWKSWLGRYEVDAGKFIFDLNSEKKWDRIDRKNGYRNSSPSDYGLSFGGGDLTINADLTFGSAQNHTFAPPSNGSVLMAQAGEFSIESIRVYKVLTKEEVQELPTSFTQPQVVHPTPPAAVPDASNIVFELLAVLVFFKILKTKFRDTPKS